MTDRDDITTELRAAQQLFDAGDFTAAAAIFQRLVDEGCRREPAHIGLAMCEMKLGHLDVAERTLTALPDPSSAVIASLGLVLLSQDRWGEGAAQYRRVLADRPDDADAMWGLAFALLKLGHHSEVEPLLVKVLQVYPGNSHGWIHLASIYRLAGRMVDAVAAYENGLAHLTPGDPLEVVAHVEYSFSALALGDFTIGFAEYEWRFKGSIKPQWEALNRYAPQWDGRLVAGVRLLVWTEQGLGDCLQFLRFLPKLIEAGMRVTLMAQQPLARLANTIAGIESVVTFTDALPEADCQVALMSVPHRLAKRAGGVTVPRNVVCLRPAVDEAAAWRSRIAAQAGGRIAVGVVWRGNPNYTNELRRSLSFPVLQDALSVPGIAYFSLQVNAPKDEAKIAADAGLIDLGPELRDFHDTACAIQALDLVVSVDTSVIHCTGALGKAGWVMLPARPDWRWGITGERTHWYPSVRLFRQPTEGAWPEVVARVRRALEGLVVSR